VLDLPVGSLDQDEGAVTDLGGCSRRIAHPVASSARC
jgi:hypothetical protein